MAPCDIITHAYFSLLSQRVPFTDDANKPILKQSLQPYFWPHITLNANLQINQPFPKIARRFFRLRREAYTDVRRCVGNRCYKRRPKRHHKTIVCPDGKKTRQILRAERFS